jgi:F-type H+-transporting ATPase subunit a
MMGPIWWIAPLIFVIELIGHFARILSLSMRLMGNMFGDHMVLSIFLGFNLLLVPLPLIALGLVVCVVQTLVFTLLTIVYIAMAIEQHDDHHEHAEAH